MTRLVETKNNKLNTGPKNVEILQVYFEVNKETCWDGDTGINHINTISKI